MPFCNYDWHILMVLLKFCLKLDSQNFDALLEFLLANFDGKKFDTFTEFLLANFDVKSEVQVELRCIFGSLINKFSNILVYRQHFYAILPPPSRDF